MRISSGYLSGSIIASLFLPIGRKHLRLVHGRIPHVLHVELRQFRGLQRSTIILSKELASPLPQLCLFPSRVFRMAFITFFAILPGHLRTSAG